MTWNPEKNSPTKINLETIKHGLNPRQTEKIKYEANLLRKSVEELFKIAPFLFVNNITAANTVAKSEEPEPTPKVNEGKDDEEFTDYSYYYGGY